ncbi:MAG: GTP diphosphokinase [Gammaproteobacteria bacterium]
MVKTKQSEHVLSDGSVDLNAWLEHLREKRHIRNLQLIREACTLSNLAGAQRNTSYGITCLQQGLAIADILADLDLDQETLATAIVYPSVQYADLNLTDVHDHLGNRVHRLVNGILQMTNINILRKPSDELQHNHAQLDNIRKMLIAMVDDIQVVLIKLAERVLLLRQCPKYDNEQRVIIAQETMAIYAPLANRLGIAQMKWELEDLAFRYLEPDTYKNIARSLQASRIQRDDFVNHIVNVLKHEIDQLKLSHYKVYGRAKHIYSIYNKMRRKNLPLQEIYDTIAMRVLVPSVEDCYKVLSIVHDNWQRIPEEFDDYIANPKPNGYSSLHTAVTTEENRHFEVQIRSFDMHHQAELGVAAHWAYKEGSNQAKTAQQQKIEWLRQVLDWQKEVTANTQSDPQALGKEIIDDRVYVFTPAGDVVDLPRGATPLDFAYHIHSEVGHRCRGAKINDQIVPLNYILQTGEQVAILTTKQSKPSRDWLNPEQGYLYTSRAKAKVHQWFRQQDYDHDREAGWDALERELHKHHLENINYLQLAQHYHLKTGNDLFAAIGRGDIKVGHLIHLIQNDHAKQKTSQDLPKIDAKKRSSNSTNFEVQGVSDVLSHTAQCCKPLPGDEIIGYITQGKGIAIHRQDCSNIKRMQELSPDRIINVGWNKSNANNQRYPVDIVVMAYQRPGLVHELTSIFASEKINLLSFNSQPHEDSGQISLFFTLEIPNATELSRINQRIQQLPDVLTIKRLG